MTKSAILEKLKAERNLDRFKDSSGWRDAFLLYNAVHGRTGDSALQMNCKGCFKEVKAWLER